MITLAVFDMAGTTIDDHGLVYVALQRSVEETGATVSSDDLQRWMGTDKVTAIQALMKLGGITPTHDIVDQQFSRFKIILNELYSEQPPQALPGVIDALLELKKRNIKIALTTGFDVSIAGPLLRNLHWAVPDTPESLTADVVVDAIVTTDDVPQGRPYPYMIHTAMERVSVDDVHSVLVAGDTAVDVLAGHNSGGIAVGVLTGGATRETLASEPYDYLVDSVADIPDLAETKPGTPDHIDYARYVPDNDYLLLTPGPLSTSKTVRAALLKDWCTWDEEYKALTRSIRHDLEDLAGDDAYTSVLMQGSGTFAVESLLGSVVGPNNKILIAANGAYGRRMITIAKTLGLSYTAVDSADTQIIDIDAVDQALSADSAITHIAMVHCETTTGILNPLSDFCRIGQAHGVTIIVDAMSSFAGVPIDCAGLGIDYLVSSSNKCIQGVPGFGFVLAKESELSTCAGYARSHALDLYDQWRAMEDGAGKWRFTSPTHVVHAFHQALSELKAEGGIAARSARYAANHEVLVDGMSDLGFSTVIPAQNQSPIITSFYYPNDHFDFASFYANLKNDGFVIYPGKLTELDTFRIGTIGDVHPDDIRRLISSIATKS